MNVRERPIIFSAPMVRAILAGRKTQTRRVMKPQPSEGWEPHAYDDLHKMVDGEFVFRNEEPVVVGWGPVDEEGYEGHRSPYGRPGDRLWVRETWKPVEVDVRTGDKPWQVKHGVDGILYKANNFFIPIENTPEAGEAWGEAYHPRGEVWRPSIHMPRWASRLTLEVVDVRVERLQAISEEDARAEGITDGGCLNCGNPEPCECPYPTPDARDAFIGLWDSLNAKRGHAWDANPWVWVVEFKRVQS